MSDQDKEVERLIRLRNQQIQTRDPGTKTRKLHGRISERERRRRRPLSLGTIWRELRHIKKQWIGAFIGGLLGFVAMIVLSATISSEVALLVGLVAIGVLGFLGMLFGMAFDWRDEISELGKG